jgi:hypothetical protein
MRDRRRHVRAADRNAAVLTILSEGFEQGLVGKVVGCTTEEVSEGGVRIRVSERIEPGTRLELRVATTQPPAAFLLKGRLVWTREGVPPGTWIAGVDITDTDEKTLGTWRQCARSKLPVQYMARPGRDMARDTGVMW